MSPPLTLPDGYEVVAPSGTGAVSSGSNDVPVALTLPDNYELAGREQKPASTISGAGQVAIDFSNQGPAAAQHTTPIISAHEKNLLSTDVHEDDAGNALFRDRGTGEMVQADRSKHVILRDPEDNTLKVFARTPETTQGIASGVGRLLGMGMGAGNIQFTKALPPAIAAAERIGVELPRAIATDSPITTMAGQVLVKSPGGGPLQQAVKSSIGQTQDAVGQAAIKAGGTVDPAVAGDNFANAIEKSFKPSVKSGLEAAYKNTESLMNLETKSQPTNTLNAVQNLVSRRAEQAQQGYGKAADLVSEAVTRPEGMTFKGLKGLRTSIGELLDSGTFPEGMSEGELRYIYRELTKDLKQAALDSGGPRALAAFEQANQLAQKVADWKEGIKKVLGPQTRSGEGVSQAIIRMASAGAGADIETLAKARNAVPAETWSDIASTAISQLGRGRNGEWSPAAFATDFRNLSDRGRLLLFRSVGSGDVVPYLDDIAKVSQKFVDAGRLANTSGSAGHEAAYASGAAVVSGVLTGSFLPPLVVIGGITGANGLARLLSQPATAASVARWSRIYHAAATSGAASAKVALEDATRRLSSTAAQNGVTISPTELWKSIQPGSQQRD